MSRLPVLAFTAIALALAPGLAGAAGDKAGKSASPTDQNPKAARQHVSTEEYLQKAAASDLFEVETGKLAVEKATNGNVKQFGRMMTQDHMRSTEVVKQAAAKATNGKPPPAKMTSHQQAMTKRLMDADGRDFDRLYIDAQLEAHRQALELHRAYAASGQDPALKKAAAEIVPVVERHLAELRKMSSTVTGMN